MGLGRRHQRREERRPGDARVHYRMRQRIFSIGDDSWIEDDDGARAYKVDGKALRLRKTLVIEDPDGHELARLKERLVHLRDSMEVEDADGNQIAMVKKSLISPLRDRWVVEMSTGPDLEIKGNVVDHEYSFRKDGDEVAAVSKKWFRVADSYGVEVEPGQEPVIILAATVAIDSMAHD